MNNTEDICVDTGLEVSNLQADSAFARRSVHPRDITRQLEGMRRLTRAFVHHPETILQELVNAAVDLCGAESAGISIEREHPTDAEYYQWVATAGQYAGFRNATLPRSPSACGQCIARNQPQIFRVAQPFYDRMGVVAPTVTDGILLPWHADSTHGTIWIMAHGRTEAFDASDVLMMQTLADFAAMAVRHHRQQQVLVRQASAASAAAMANDLAHQINNPLQSLTNLLFLAHQGQPGSEAQELAAAAAENLARLSLLVQKLLILPSFAASSDHPDKAI